MTHRVYAPRPHFPFAAGTALDWAEQVLVVASAPAERQLADADPADRTAAERLLAG
ncbi:MAG TPA: hypothetical protein VK932_01975 [Kofleriaceae bacterium]|nr:hypothetical protein [Kofleriaceae bacterium]